MKDDPCESFRRAGTRLALLAALAFAAACSKEPAPAVAAATPVSSAIPGCARHEVEAALHDLQSLAMQRDLVMKQIQAYRADAYYEDNLNHDLWIFRELGQKAGEVAVPPCLEQAKAHFVEGIELSHAAYDARRPGRESSEFMDAHARARSAHERYIAEANAQIERIR